MKDKDLLDKIIALNEDIVKLKMENVRLKEGLKRDNALVTGDIEIPFGAKDSELQEVSYHIPEGFHAEIEGDKVTISRGEKKSLTIDIKSMVDSYEQRLIKNGGVSNSPLVNMCVEAFQHGVENTLDELYLKQILANSCETCKDEWNAEKKELKKIPQRMVSAEAKEAMYDKPAWSKEDEVKINRIVACLENLNVADNDILLKDVDWLKSLKQRIEG